MKHALITLSLVFCISLVAACGPEPNGNSVPPPKIPASPAPTPPLVVAAREGKDDVVKSLLTGGDINVNSADAQGNTALIEAARFGHDDVVRALVARGADHKLKNREGQTALMLAVKNGHDDVIRLLREAGATE